MSNGDGELTPYIPTLTEQLTANFYMWERRGRGWQVWDYPVEIEPHYQPFFHNIPSRPAVQADDGRKDTLLSSLVGSLFSKGEEKEPLPTPELTYDELPPAYIDDSDLKEIRISLSQDQKISSDHAERFLLNLSYCSMPLSFEIIGTRDSISVQLACRNTDLPQLKQQLQAYFPDAVLSEEESILKSLWKEGKDTVVVDFGLSHEFMRPLKTFRNFEPDPLIGIIGALDNLDEGEIGIFQVLFKAVRNPWAESILRSVTDGEGRAFFADSPEMLSLAKEKVSKPLFGAVIRVAAQSSSESRAWEISKALSSGLTLVANPQSNELIPLTNDYYEDLIHKEDVLRRQTHRGGMILNSDELISLVHLPSVSVRAEKLIRELKKTRPAPAISIGHQLVLGENLHQGKKTTVTLSIEQRLRHMYLIGATGTGKSTMLLKLIAQDIKNGLGIAVLDPHGDLIDLILGYVPEDRYEDVVLLDPSDVDYPVGFNILSAHSEVEKNVLSSDLVSVFKRLSTSWGDQMTSVLSNAVLAFLESEDGGTLPDLRRFLVETTYRNNFLKTVKDPDVVYYWQKEFPLLTGKPQASVLTRLNIFLRPKLIRYMVAQKEGINLEDIMNNKKIFLAKLSQGLIGEENAYLLGTLIVSKLQQVAMARQARKQSERENFFLYIDEFHNFITPSMASILSGARKYNLGLILAHQELRQLWNRDTEVANSVISNPYTRICFRLGDFDAHKLESGLSSYQAKDLQNLGIGEAVCRIERTDYDFNLKTFPPEDVDPDVARKRHADLIDLSRSKYSLSKEEVEELLSKDKEPIEQPDITRGKATKGSQAGTSESPGKKTVSEKRDEMSPDEKGFLRFVSENPGMFVTKVYKSLELSGYKGDMLKESLIEKDLIVQEETRGGLGGRLAKVLNLTESGASLAKKLSPTGKGGNLHQHLQMMFKEQAELYGWKATIEERIPRSFESVDVGLKKDDIKVAIEISSTSKASYEVQNIRKCLEAGYDYVISVCSDDKQRSLIKRDAQKGLNLRERERVRFYHSVQVKDFLQSPHPGIVSEKGIDSKEIPKQKQLLDTKEVSELLGISRSTLYEWIIQKKIPCIKVGRLVKFKKSDLEEWIRKRTQNEEKISIP